MDNFFNMKIKATLKNVSLARVAISSFVSDYNITIDELMDIKTAVSEAVTNSIEHGYNSTGNESNIVDINCKIIKEEETKIEIEIIDYGIGIEDIELATTPTYTSKPELEHAGMGFTIMETFMDEILIDSTVNDGTKITMTKTIKKHKSY